MSYKQKKQQRRKGKKHKKPPPKNVKNKKYTLKKMKKQKKRNNYSTTNKKKNTNEPTAPNYQLSLSPFYSFSNHWSYLTRQYLCLSTWGTCMGGINESYDDLLDQEASGPLVEENYKQALAKWRQEKAKYEKYNRDNANKYEKITDEKLTDAYNATNEYNRYNVYNYPNYNKTINNNYYAAPPKQYAPPPPPPPPSQPRQLATQTNKNIIYEEQHRCPEYTYQPTQNELNNKHKNESTISATAIDYAFDTYEDTENNYMPASDIKYDKAENNIVLPSNYTIGVEHEETETHEKNMDFLASPDPDTFKKPGIHITGGQSFGRKLSMFDDAAKIKRRHTIEQKEWKQQHSKDEDDDGAFRPYDNNGVQYIEQFTFHPAAVHIQPHAPRKVSNRDFAKHMDQYADPDNIVTDDKVANMSASEKIKLFSKMSVGHEDDK